MGVDGLLALSRHCQGIVMALSGHCRLRVHIPSAKHPRSMSIPLRGDCRCMSVCRGQIIFLEDMRGCPRVGMTARPPAPPFAHDPFRVMRPNAHGLSILGHRQCHLQCTSLGQPQGRRGLTIRCTIGAVSAERRCTMGHVGGQHRPVSQFEDICDFCTATRDTCSAPQGTPSATASDRKRTVSAPAAHLRATDWAMSGPPQGHIDWSDWC